ncbi:VOC family protein [Myxococcaceae bacterium GXIMD 01537]
MPKMTGFKKGMFCWSDLSTTDVPAAKRFYTELFGWNYADVPVGEGHVYSMAQVGGDQVAALSGMLPEMTAQGMPPHWSAYIWVEDIDAHAKQVEALGGKLVAPPFDIMDAGRMCVLQDPTGALLSLWQPKRHGGASVMGEPGALVWVELGSPDTERAQAFYSKLLGWKPKTQQMGDMRYTQFLVGDNGVAGMMQTPPGQPPHWLVYFAVKDCDAIVALATKLGGKVHVPPSDIPDTGRFSVMQDPQGAFFGIIKLKPMP